MPRHPTPKINSSPWTMEDGWPSCSFSWLKSFPVCWESIHVKLCFWALASESSPMHWNRSLVTAELSSSFLAAFPGPQRCLVHSCISGLRWRLASWGELAVDVAASVYMWILTCNHHNHESCHSSHAWPLGPYFTACGGDNTIPILQLWRLRFRGKEWLKQSHGVPSQRRLEPRLVWLQGPGWFIYSTTIYEVPAMCQAPGYVSEKASCCQEHTFCWGR